MANPVLEVGDLKVSGFSDPIGIDDLAPTLSWRILAPLSATQTAYRVEVASSLELLASNDADLWDSGKVPASTSYGIKYEGSPLGSRSRCYWRVTVWDAAHQSAHSIEPAYWEMGLLDPSDWLGEWLAAESSDERDERQVQPLWFGNVEGPAEFRAVVETETSAEVTLLIASDGIIKGVSCDGVAWDVPKWHEHAFGGPPAMRCTFNVKPGLHTLLIAVERHPNPLFKPTIALAGQLRIKPECGAVTHFAIDGWEIDIGGSGSWSTADSVRGRQYVSPPAGGARDFRREFSSGRAPKAARLYVAALGGYEVFINGHRVSQDELQSEPTDYKDLIPYRSYDVTGLVTSGTNVVAATIADGFFASYTAPEGRYMFAPPPRRWRAMLVLEKDGGRTDWVVTDSSWKTAPSCVLMSEMYNGETVDLRADHPSWMLPNFDDTSWATPWAAPKPSGVLAASYSPPIRATERLKPVNVDRRKDGRLIIDFGQNFAGRVELRTRGVAGQEISIRHSEILDEGGELDVRNLRAAAATDRFILKDSESILLKPRFVYHGFRYAEVSGISDFDTCQIDGVVLTSNLAETGSLNIDNPTIQRLWQNTLWSQRSNFVGIPTDCPQRDERLGWTGDAQIFWDTAAFNMDVAGFTRSFTREMRIAQLPNGTFPMWAPMARFQHPAVETATPGWADAGVELPYVAYIHSGDRTLVDENWDAMTSYVSGLLDRNPDGIWRHGRGADFGDHLSLDSVAFGPPSTPPELIATAMLFRDVQHLVHLAKWTERDAETSKWEAVLADIRAAFVKEFVTGDGKIGNESHTSYILAIRLGLVPESLLPTVRASFVEAIRERGSLLTTGFLGTPLALDALADIGETELAYSLLLRTEYPSWGYMVEKDATTIWERWNGDTGDVSMNSFNHYALGAVCAFLYRRVCGIEAISPGFSKFRIAPLPDRRIPSARASYESASGTIVSGWEWAGSELKFAIIVPPNSTASLSLPGRVISGDLELAFDGGSGLSRGEAGPGAYELITRP